MATFLSEQHSITVPATMELGAAAAAAAAGGVKRVGDELSEGQSQGGANKRRAALSTLTNRQSGSFAQQRPKV